MMDDGEEAYLPYGLTCDCDSYDMAAQSTP